MFPSNHVSHNGSSVPMTGEVESPFLAAMTPAREEPGMETGESVEQSEALLGGQIESPFRVIYHEAEAGEGEDPASQAMAEFLAEMHDEEFDEALAELANEATALMETQLANGGGTNGYAPDHSRVERLLQHHFAPLEMAVEQMFESAAARVEDKDLSRMSEGELESLLEASTPALQEANPAFEFFLGKLVKKAVNLAKKGAGAIASLGLGPALRMLARLAKPLIKKVLQLAINKLPAQLQPVAQQLAQRYLKIAPPAASTAQTAEPAPDSPAAELQYEFDMQLAEMLFAQPGGMDSEMVAAEYESQASADLENHIDNLAHARQHFVQSIQQLREGEDPTPAVENFLPAILPALKLAMKIIGRERVVKRVASPVGKLIGRFVGPKYTPMLARAMVDAGLRLLNLETTQEEARLAAGEAVALTVEETVRRVADLPEYVLENEALLESFTVQAFEAAAAANLPPVLPEAVYQRRPDLRESSGPAGAWVLLPRGPDGHRYYQKYSRVFQDVPIPPHVAMTVKTFGGRPLSAFLRDSLGVLPQPGLTARVHVYEAVPGTWLSRIARWERGVPGLNGGRQGWRMLHPLTPQAAGLLLGEPALGREMPLDARNDPSAVAPGERFYYLEVPGGRPQSTQADGGLPGLRRSSDVRLELDFQRSQVRAYVYLSESDAQEMAVRLRQGGSTAGVMTGLNTLLDTVLRDIFSNGLYSKVKMNHRIAVLWPVSGYALKRIPTAALERFRHQLMEWLGRAQADFFSSRSASFVTASQDPADGLSMVITLDRVPGFDQLDRLLLGQAVGPVETLFTGDRPEAGVQVVPGFARG